MEEVHVSSKLCELCNDQAAIFCPSDSSFLCFHCDANVHQANFLVARHLRLTLCSHCNSLTESRFLPSSPRPALCTSCSRNSSADSDHLHSLSSSSACWNSDLHSLSSSSSSTCVSSTQSSGTTQRNISSFDRKQLLDSSTGEVNSAGCELVRYTRMKLRDPKAAIGNLFMHWCAKLGMYGEEDTVRTAFGALRICFGRFKALPARVVLAACLWFGLRSNDDGLKSTWQSLKRLEEISGVQVKLILATELKLRRIVKANKQRRREGMEESWGEWSP